MAVEAAVLPIATVARRTGIVCLLLIVAIFALSFPLRCVPRALGMESFTAADGFAFGALLAGITRTCRPGLIYLLMALAALTLWPVFISWPPAEVWEVHLWPGATTLLLYYFDAARFAVFLLAMPYPFVRWGQHGPDPIKT
jgi:hypothetical protein